MKHFFDTITLGSGHSMLLPYAPKILSDEQVNKVLSDTKRDTSSFGLFECATPNFQTYYPEVEAEDLLPEEEDYVRPIFRLLSEVIVRKKFDPIDFSQDGVLKASMKKLVGQTVYPNHEPLVGNEVGVVSRTFWQEAYRSDSGVKVPAGINGEFMIDGKSHPKLARGMMSNPPSIHSNSVTVHFQWVQSHPKMSADEFRSKVATFGSDGQLVRRIVSEIMSYSETSLVSHGADPYAQIVGADGKIVNPNYARSQDSLSELRDTKGNKVFYFDYKDIASLTAEPTEEEKTILTHTNNKNEDFMKDKVLLATIALLGLSFKLEDITDAQLTEIETKLAEYKNSAAELATAKETVNTLTTEKSAAEAKVTELTATVSTLTAEKLAAEEIKAEKLAEVKRLYSALGKSDAAILSSFETMPVKALSAFEKNYQTELEAVMPHVCQDCKSTNVARNSATPEPGQGKPAEQSLQDYIKKTASGTGKADLSTIHGN